MPDEATTNRSSPIALLAHPLVLLAVFVTAVNDHLLKGSGWLPGVVTGKLSDITGLFFFPVLLAVLFYLAVWAATATVARLKPERLFDTRLLIDAGVVLTIVVFSALNLSETANRLAEPYWGVVTMDATDLLCLPMALLARQFARRRWPRPATNHAASIPSSINTRLKIRWHHGLAIAAACFVSIATSRMAPTTTSISGYPYWELTDHTVHCVHDVEVRSWFAKSGDEGAGLVVRFDGTGDETRTIEVESAYFDIWREHDTRTADERRVVGRPASDRLSVHEGHSLYIPFHFDNRSARRDGFRDGRITMTLRFDDHTEQIEWDARHRSSDKTQEYLRYEVWQHGQDDDELRRYNWEPETWGVDPENPDLERTGPHVDRDNEHLLRNPDDPDQIRIHTRVPWEGGCPGGHDD